MIKLIITFSHIKFVSSCFNVKQKMDVEGDKYINFKMQYTFEWSTKQRSTLPQNHLHAQSETKQIHCQQWECHQKNITCTDKNKYITLIFGLRTWLAGAFCSISGLWPGARPSPWALAVRARARSGPGVGTAARSWSWVAGARPAAATAARAAAGTRTRAAAITCSDVRERNLVIFRDSTTMFWLKKLTFFCGCSCGMEKRAFHNGPFGPSIPCHQGDVHPWRPMHLRHHVCHRTYKNRNHHCKDTPNNNFEFTHHTGSFRKESLPRLRHHKDGLFTPHEEATI